MIVTQAVLNKGMSLKGAWSKKQLWTILPDWERDDTPGSLGVKKGWKRRILGANVPVEKIQQFWALKDDHISAADKTGNLFEQPNKRFWPDDLELEPDSPEYEHMQSIKQEIKHAS